MPGAPQPPLRKFRIYLCGSYRDLRGSDRKAKRFLRGIERVLRLHGFEAFTQLHPTAKRLAGRGQSAAEMTRVLERQSDLCVYVGLVESREGGWCSELSDIQARYPEGASKRVVLLEAGFPLSRVLANDMGGHLSDPFVPVINWETEDELIAVIMRCAAALHERGVLPVAMHERGRLRLSLK